MDQANIVNGEQTARSNTFIQRTTPLLVLLAILALGAYLRFTGLDWDERTHPHPDERFLTMVETSLKLPSSLGEYFDTDHSQFNPVNVGYGFFVYGTLPIFLVRWLGEAVGMVGYDEIQVVGRTAAAAFDLISIFLTYLIGRRLYKEWTGLLAAALSAFSVLLIQHAHFFVVEAFANTFILAGFYFCIGIYQRGRMRDYLLFGIMLGLAMASKISSFPLAAISALAALLRVLAAEPEQRRKEIKASITYLCAAAGIAFLVFRIAQPYAFQGPSFFGMIPNSHWLGNLREVRMQQSGNVDFPPALQWANRTPVLFSLKNMILWGLGIPLGITAWLGWGTSLIQIIRKRNLEDLLLVVWVGGFFLWQSTNATPAMRYQLPVYPFLAILAARLLTRLFAVQILPARVVLQKIMAGLITLMVVAATAWYAFAFHSMFLRPNTQVAASRWIYENIPAGVNLSAQRAGESIQEPLPIPERVVLAEGVRLSFPFQVPETSFVDTVTFSLNQEMDTGAGRVSVAAWVYDENQQQILATGFWEREDGGFQGLHQLEIQLDADFLLDRNEEYLIEIVAYGGQETTIRSTIQFSNAETQDSNPPIEVSLPRVFVLTNMTSQLFNIPANSELTIDGITLPYIRNLDTGDDHYTITAEILAAPDAQVPLSVGIVGADSAIHVETSLSIALSEPVRLDSACYLRLTLVDGAGIQLRGSKLTNETGWDLALPARMDNRDGFGGLYTGVSQEMYWADDQDDNDNGISDKLERIVNSLDDGDYLVIATNRQYGTVARVPVRYPLSSAYYRMLFACPPDRSVIDCAARAKVGLEGDIPGIDLVATFDSNPSLGGIEFNDQYAEEAFTVYDHPKVFIFQKNPAEFDPDYLAEQLGLVDLSYVDNSPPAQLSEEVKSLLLSGQQEATLREASTWSDLFNPDNALNQSALLSVFTWWGFLFLLGVICFPLTRLVFRGLQDRGYAFSRILGMLLFAYLAWLAGSMQIILSRTLLAGILAVMTGGSFLLVWREREQVKTTIKAYAREILWTEILALVVFLIFLGIRAGNPDLWHPAKGGEKPMDFAYFNAILKTPFFPSYDPWFAGGYINYYYFGFVLAGMPVRLLGIVPANAYNLLIPTMAALTALGAYGVVRNLAVGTTTRRRGINAKLTGVIAAVMITFLGNLGNLRLIYHALQKAGGNGAYRLGFFTDIGNAFNGFIQILGSDTSLPVALDQWYWDASRAITPGIGEPGPITEFPFFTFIYADLHAHMINLALTLLVLGWCVSVLLAARQQKNKRLVEFIPALIIGALAIGVLRPTNTWDYPVYWLLGGLALIGAVWLYYEEFSWKMVRTMLVGAGLFFGLARLFFFPYDAAYLQGYTSVHLWQGSRTSLTDYIVSHGLFLFLLFSWLVYESRKWMAETPLSVLGRARPFWGIAATLTAILAAVIGVAAGIGYTVALLALPGAFWCGILFLRRDMPLEKRIVLLLAACALSLTFMVEVIVLEGDIGRMNTVFKFYLQVWTLLGISAAMALYWVWNGEYFRAGSNWGSAYTGMIAILFFGSLLYPLAAAPAKVRDRVVTESPRGIRGDSFMMDATFFDQGVVFSILEDYQAIQWMQRNIVGTPVIVEASVPEYRWGSRYSIYTGLPTVLGWNWHQRQQRVSAGAQEVSLRSGEIADFYMTTSIEAANAFIDIYHVEYIIAGVLERIYYVELQPCLVLPDTNEISCDLAGKPMGMVQPELTRDDCVLMSDSADTDQYRCDTGGLQKFENMVAMGFLQIAYRTGETTVYEVLP